MSIKIKNIEKTAYISGHGSALPDFVLENHALPQHLDTSDEWIRKRTGIRRRHILGSRFSTVDLAAAALDRALATSPISASQLDGIIVATTTPERTMPSTSILVQERLGITNCAISFDLQAACAGFVAAMQTAYSLIISGQASAIAVVGADTMSRTLDWGDRSTAVLFGDGAGAVILQSCELDLQTADSNPTRGILDMMSHTRPDLHGSLCTGWELEGHIFSPIPHPDFALIDPAQHDNANNTGIRYCSRYGKLAMDGRTVFRHATHEMSRISLELLSRNGLSTEDLAWIIPHQANQRIMEAIGENTGIPREKLVSTVSVHANTSAASIPLALDLLAAASHGMASQKGEGSGVPPAFSSPSPTSHPQYPQNLNTNSHTFPSGGSDATMAAVIHAHAHDDDDASENPAVPAGLANHNATAMAPQRLYKPLTQGDLILMVAVGSGMVFNGMLLRW